MEKGSAKVQVAYYSKSEKKNRSLFLSENVRRLKRRLTSVEMGNLFGF